MRKRVKKRKGFMILELVIAVAIIGVLAAMAVPNLIGLTDEAKVARIQSDLSAIGAYPSSLSGLVGNSGEGYLKKLPDPPDKSVTYELKDKGEVIGAYKGKIYSSFGTTTQAT